MFVKKKSGELVRYKPKALMRSLRKSGAKKEDIAQVFEKISNDLYDEISTEELYEKAFNYLKIYRNSYAARYSLKKALRNLGPEGYLFENWVGRLMQTSGYESVTSQIVNGSAVSHEIDVVAVKENDLIFCECKFRNSDDAKISVVTPMYFLSRLKDVENNFYEFFDKKLKPTKGYLITNAYLTKDCKAFAEHYGLGLISWDYPKKNSIKYLVDHTSMYPITCLTTLGLEQHKKLLAKDCILVKDLVNNPGILSELKIKKAKIDEVLEEANELIKK